jgi:(S)-ureidoglycine aminohydrolase
MMTSTRILFLLSLPLFLLGSNGLAQTPISADSPATEARLASQVYRWADLPVEEKTSGERRQILKGSTTHLKSFEIHATTLLPHLAPHPPHVHAEEEELLIIKEGQVEVQIGAERTILGPGSVALILPGEEHGFQNVGDSPASYYVLKYQSHAPMNAERGAAAGSSFVVDWEEIAVREHSKGSRRDFYDRATVMTENFEMHVTQLNENTQSHPPHTHVVEEIILMVEGDVEMHIDGKTPTATAGDLIFLDSQVPHAPTNIGKGRCLYFAFQWR